MGLFRSLRPDFIETSGDGDLDGGLILVELFRSLGPDFIETLWSSVVVTTGCQIVPVFKTGLH